MHTCLTPNQETFAHVGHPDHEAGAALVGGHHSMLAKLHCLTALLWPGNLIRRNLVRVIFVNDYWVNLQLTCTLQCCFSQDNFCFFFFLKKNVFKTQIKTCTALLIQGTCLFSLHLTWIFHVLATLARKVPVMKISMSMVITSWTMRRIMAAGHSSVMQRKPYPMVVWDSREKRKAPVSVCICITQGVWFDGGSNSGGKCLKKHQKLF